MNLEYDICERKINMLSNAMQFSLVGWRCYNWLFGYKWSMDTSEYWAVV